LAGEFCDLTNIEKKAFSDKGIEDHLRLSCQIRVNADITVSPIMTVENSLVCMPVRDQLNKNRICIYRGASFYAVRTISIKKGEKPVKRGFSPFYYKTKLYFPF
jgi:hypothetical protein